MDGNDGGDASYYDENSLLETSMSLEGYQTDEDYVSVTRTASVDQLSLSLAQPLPLALVCQSSPKPSPEEEGVAPEWNYNNSLENEDFDGDEIGGRSYADFEEKLEKGFLEAPNLGLVCAPPAIFDYRPAIQRIDLKDNKIELLPEHFFDELPMLRWCDVRYNRLQELPPMTMKHEHLNVLLVQNNQISSLPCSLAYASKLHTLGWTNNGISDPPRHVLLRGCHAILVYLRNKLAHRIPVDQHGKLIPLHGDHQLQQDLDKTATKSTRKFPPKTSILSGQSQERNEELSHKRRIDRLKYTWGLWENVPYTGVNNHTLFEKSMQEVKDDMKTRQNRNKEATLQRMKDNDMLGKWRWEARMMQMKGPTHPYSGVEMPFGTDADIPNNEMKPSSNLDAEGVRASMSECMKKLQEFALNPPPVDDVDKSKQRLREVEDVHRKMQEMRLAWSVKSSNPV